MLCDFEPTGDVNGEGWKKHQCNRCGYISVFIPDLGQKIFRQCDRPGMGDYVSWGLSLIGITKARVSWLLGKDCKCEKNQEELNELGKRIGI